MEPDPVPCSANDVAARVRRELAAIADVVVREALRSRIMSPERHLRHWDHGAPGERHPCWTVAADPGSDSAIVYSEHGFGPASPWGIVSLSKPWFGMDSGWFPRLEDAFVDSFLAAELPIRDVVAEGAAGTVRRVASSLPMDEAFAMRDALASRDPQGRYHVVYRSRPAGSFP
ncbi:MAG TPA: hypothetical protein VF006_18750 [Longimicrobium sp.]